MYDIESFVTHHFREYGYYGNPPTDIKVDCPFCESRGVGEDNKQHLHISLTKDMTHCFRCEYARSWVNFVMDFLGVSYYHALGELLQTNKIRGDVKSEVMNRMVVNGTVYDGTLEFSLPYDFELLDSHNTRLHRVARNYVTKRGFSSDDWKYYQLGVSQGLGYRVIIPIEDDYWQGRSLHPYIEPKYINPKNPSRFSLFNYKALELYDTIVVCEGAFSAMAVGRNAVAILAKKATKEKAERLLDSKASKFIITVEPGAYRSMGDLAETLYKNNREVMLWKYSKGDPADPDGAFEEMTYDLKAKVLCKLNA